MAIDPNIPLQAGVGVPQLDVVGTLGKVQSLQNAQLQNKLGTVDLATKEQGLATARQNALANVARTALLSYDDRTPESLAATTRPFVDALHNGIVHWQNAGLFDQRTAQDLINGIANTKDVRALAEQTQRYSLLDAGPVASFSQIYGQGGTVDTGGEKQPGVFRSPMRGGGFTPSGPAIPSTLGPASQTELVDVPEMRTNADGTETATGVMLRMTKAELATRTGRGNTVPGGGAFPQGYTGRPTGGAPVPPTPAPARAPSGVVGKSLAPGQGAAMEAAGRSAEAQSAALFRASDAAVSRKAQLDTMVADLARIPSSGPGTARQAQIEAFLQKFGGFGITLSPSELASTENFAKVAKVLAGQQATALGVGSDERLANAVGSNPNLDLSKRGNAEILAMLKGTEDSIIAKSRAWQKWLISGNSPDTYNKFQTQFNRDFDPRVFQWVYLAADMNEAERRKYLAKMPDADQFRANYNAAVKSGMLKPGG